MWNYLIMMIIAMMMTVTTTTARRSATTTPITVLLELLPMQTIKDYRNNSLNYFWITSQKHDVNISFNSNITKTSSLYRPVVIINHIYKDLKTPKNVLKYVSLFMLKFIKK